MGKLDLSTPFLKGLVSKEDLSSSQCGQQLMEFRREQPMAIPCEQPVNNVEETPMFPAFQKLLIEIRGNWDSY